MSEQSVSNWKRQFIETGRAGLAAGSLHTGAVRAYDTLRVLQRDGKPPPRFQGKLSRRHRGWLAARGR